MSWMPRSPRIVPGAAFRGFVAPISVAHDLPGVLGALDDHGDDRAAAHERHEVVVEGLADVLLVVAGERVVVERAHAPSRRWSGPWPRTGTRIAPTSPRSTASGLSSTKVRSDMAGEATGVCGHPPTSPLGAIVRRRLASSSVVQFETPAAAGAARLRHPHEHRLGCDVRRDDANRLGETPDGIEDAGPPAGPSTASAVRDAISGAPATPACVARRLPAVRSPRPQRAGRCHLRC